MKKVRVRYAPSPTGHLHIGNARTALFNYLFAKHYNGDFVLRIEDTDIERNVEGGEESQLYYLHWLGIDPDESPQNPKPQYAPYRQMERLDLYHEIANQLLKKGFAYKCFCTPEELEEDYKKQTEAGIASTRYNRKCLHLSPQEVQEKEAAGLPYTIRCRVPDHKTYQFDDLIRGHVSFESKDIGDWVLMKANGIPTYNFAVVIDDHSMEISHVLRGEEHLSNTPKQLMLYEMLGWEAPKFGHMTLIVNEQHKKLSKRDNSILQYMSQYKELGYLPQAMFNFMALLGWSPPGEQEIFTKEQLIEIFDEGRLSKSPSMFDKGKLAWVNNRYLREMSLPDLTKLCYPYLAKAYDLKDKSEDWLNTLVGLYQEQLSCGSELVGLAEQFFKPFHVEEEATEVLTWETTPIVVKAFLKRAEAVLEWNTDEVRKILKETMNDSGIKGKPLYMGIRVAASGYQHGPDLASTLVLLGKDEVMDRLNKAI